jgi:hypothetical protein
MRGLGSIAQPQEALAQRRHQTRIVFVLVVSGVQRVEHDYLGGGLTGGVEKVIQSLRCAEQIAAGARVHQQVLIGGRSQGSAHHRQPTHKLGRGQFKLADQNPARSGNREAGAVFARGQRQSQITLTGPSPCVGGCAFSSIVGNPLGCRRALDRVRDAELRAKMAGPRGYRLGAVRLGGAGGSSVLCGGVPGGLKKIVNAAGSLENLCAS